MARHLLLTMVFLLAGLALKAQTSLQGKVTDNESGQSIIFGTVALYKNGSLITGTETDFDGFYSITELDPGTYDVEFSYTGYQSTRITNVVVSAGKANKLDAKISAGVTLNIIEVTYTKPLIEQDNTSQGATLTSEEIKNLPTRNVNALASLSAGVAAQDEGDNISIRGSRDNATNYYIDGVRVSGRSLPKQEIEQLQIITGGLEARYGDVTGGVISLTTKGPSEKFSGGLELETSKFLDQFDHRLAALNISGPIWKRKGETVIGYRFSGQYQYNKDDDPPALPVYSVKEEVRQELEQNPIRQIGNTVLPAAQFLDQSAVDVLDYKPNEDRSAYDFTGKLDFGLGKNIDLTVSGTGYYVRDKFTPNDGFSNGRWRVFNSYYNPTNNDYRYRGNVRLRHRLGGATTSDEEKKGSLIQNATYVLQFGYEKEKNDRKDKRHGDNLGNYGYIGNFDATWTPTRFDPGDPDQGININEAIGFTSDSFLIFASSQIDYTQNFISYTPNTEINPILTRYVPGDAFNPFQPLVFNGFVTDALEQTWADHWTNIGQVYNLNRKRENDIYTFNANTSFELVPKGSGGSRHNVQFGIMYEQRTERGYDVFPRGLWTTARQLSNAHLEGAALDTLAAPLGYLNGLYYEWHPFFGLRNEDTAYQFPIYPLKPFDIDPDNIFAQKVRQKLGNIPLYQQVNVDGMNPNDLTLDLFSARELNDDALINYWGYDYLGNQLDGVTFNDFFTATDANGVRTFPVAAFRPNYQSAYIQDKFTFKDVILRLGVRVDRFDANTKVLKDPYSLYDIMTAGDFSDKFGVQRPGNIEDDFKVYVTAEDSEIPKAYRDGNTWYFANGTPANDGSDIFGGGLVFPKYTESNIEARDVTSKGFNTDLSFEDYKPQVNWMPRLAFSFPISEEANFFAHYDILVQRPPGRQFVSPRTYFYWETNGSGLRNNANLRPEKTIDYEVGFQQKLSNSSALKLSAYYKELRDMIQTRWYLFVPAPVNSYQTFDNIDFATVKGFSVAYDLRRTGNISLNLTYTLQFADGTGSDDESQRNAASRGVQRTLFPMSYDERHRLSAIVDYRYGSGKMYNGPSIGGVDILSDFGVNLTAIAVSGRPYTKAVQADAFGASGTASTINGARLPWNMTFNLQVDKQFNLTKPGAARSVGMNLYLRVSNLLDRRNIISVYRFTGSADDDGFLNSSRGEGFFNALEPEYQAAFLASYSWRMLNPDNYSLPRRIFLGAVFDF